MGEGAPSARSGFVEKCCLHHSTGAVLPVTIMNGDPRMRLNTQKKSTTHNIHNLCGVRGHVRAQVKGYPSANGPVKQDHAYPQKNGASEREERPAL